MPRPRKQLPIGIERRIRELAVEGFSPSQIWREIGEDRVDLKTVQRRCKEYSVPDTSEPWTLADSTPGDAALVLPVLAAVAERTNCRAWISKERAGWIARVRTVAPTLPPFAAYVIAGEYQRAEAQGNAKLARTIDLYLASHAWEDEGAAARFRGLLKRAVRDFKPGIPVYLDSWWEDVETMLYVQDGGSNER